jgi:hypothetical protein
LTSPLAERRERPVPGLWGGGTPAALAADWLAPAYDQVAYAWASSALAAHPEQVAIDWLRQLFELFRARPPP